MPFEEDDKDASIWFLDHNYHEAMFDMFKRINGKGIFGLCSECESTCVNSCCNNIEACGCF